MVAVVTNVSNPAQHLGLKAGGDRTVDELGHPLRGAIAHNLFNDLRVTLQPHVGFVHHQIHQPVVRAVPHDLGQQPPHHRRLVRSDEFRHQKVAGERRDCRIMDPCQHVVNALAGPLHHNVLVAFDRQPRAHTLRHLR